MPLSRFDQFSICTSRGYFALSVPVLKQAKSLLNPAAPKLAPPREAIVAGLLEAKRKKREEEDASFKRRCATEDVEFDMFDKVTPKPRVFRRHSISSSESLYRRVCVMKGQILFRCAMKRTNSLPDLMGLA
jgi:hypothetical protein